MALFCKSIIDNSDVEENEETTGAFSYLTTMKNPIGDSRYEELNVYIFSIGQLIHFLL